MPYGITRSPSGDDALRSLTATVDPPSLAAATSGNAPAVAVPGVKAGDPIIVTGESVQTNGLVCNGGVALTDGQVTFRYTNATAGVVDGLSRTVSFLHLS